MYPDSLWKKELIEEARSRRGFLLKFVLPFLLLAPLSLPAVPVGIRATGLAIAVLFLGVFGSSIRLSRFRENRMLERLAVLPISARRLTAEYLFASSCMDLLELMLPAVLVVSTLSPPPICLLSIALSFIGAILAANAIGIMVAIVAGTSSEGHLYAILTVLGISALSGFFDIPIEIVEYPGLALPFCHLAAALLHYGASDPAIGIIGLSTGALVGFCTLIVSPRLFTSAAS